MRTFTGKWITNKDFYDLKPINVFHKAEEPFEYTPREEIQNKHILFRCEFTLDDINGTKIFISADDYYKLYINGKFVSMGPCPGYNFEYYYNEIDISDYVKKRQKYHSSSYILSGAYKQSVGFGR